METQAGLLDINKIPRGVTAPSQKIFPHTNHNISLLISFFVLIKQTGYDVLTNEISWH